MSQARSTLLVYNTVDRLLRGDLFHTVTAYDVLHDLSRYDADWPVVGIGTLAVLAATARRIVGDRPVLAVLDARRGEVYGQAFAADGAPIGPPEVAPPAHFTAGLRPGTVVAGSGADLVAAGTGVTIAHRRATADIADLVRLGRAAPPPTAAPRPLYLRPPDAKPQANAAVARR